MECKDVQEMLADYLGDELDSSCRNAFDNHLAICLQCRREVESLQRTLRSLEQLAGPAERNSWDASLSRSKTPRRYVLRLLTYAATLVIGVGIGWFGSPKLSGSNKVFVPFPHKTEHDIMSRNLERQLPDQFVRNAIALSAALSQPLGDSRYVR